MSDKKSIHFLLGSNTKRGFIPLFDELRDPVNSKRLYIIKGGPGSGKSSLMKRVIKSLEERNDSLEFIHCASDPSSLDAFIDYDAGIAIVDGTAPHIMDPRYPGAYDVIINMADCWDDSVLINKKSKIIQLSYTIANCHQMATACISAATALLDNNIQISKSYVNQTIVNDFIHKILKEIKGAKAGKEKKRLLSAVSVGKTVFFSETIKALSTIIYTIPDMWGAASSLILSELHHTALSLGIEHITCYCSIRTPEKIDHIIFPSVGITVTTVNDFHWLNNTNQHIVEDLEKPIKKSELEQMSLHLHKAKELIDMASNHIERAKLLHDDLEAFYVNAMDFSNVDDIYYKILNEIS